MYPRIAAVIAASAAALAVALAAAPAQAGPAKRDGYQTEDLSSQSRRSTRTAQRSRSRITVRPRSYLDPGTEVFPGSMGYTDYAFPPGYQAYSNFDPTGAARWPLPGPFEFRSYHAPGGGY
jgi:hypothetical protein